MGVGSGLFMYDVVVKRSRALSHLLISSCYRYASALLYHMSLLHGFVYNVGDVADHNFSWTESQLMTCSKV